MKYNAIYSHSRNGNTQVYIEQKPVQDFYAENYKSLMKELEENLNKETYCVQGLED